MDYREEILWDVLVKKTKQEDEGKRPDQQIEHAYLNAIMMICDYGVKLAKTIRNTFPMYTLHDDTHICNVLRLMKDLLGERLCDLSRDETAMLLLSACCHDIGMSYSDQDKKELLEDKDRLERYLEANPGEYVKAALIHPQLFAIKPENVAKKVKIIQYYKQIQGKEHDEIVFSLSSEQTLYEKILNYMVKTSDGSKNAVNKDELVSYLKKSRKIYDFVLPENELKKDFIRFIRDFSERELGKQIFVLH